MHEELTHLKWRQAIKNDKNIGKGGLTIGSTAYHKSRACLYNQYEEGLLVFSIIKRLKERKTINPKLPIAKIVETIQNLLGRPIEEAVVVTALIARGFHCVWRVDGPYFNISTAGKALVEGD